MENEVVKVLSSMLLTYDLEVALLQSLEVKSDKASQEV